MTDTTMNLMARSAAGIEAAGDVHVEPTGPDGDAGRSEDRVERISTFTRVLRGLGALLVVAAASTFMVQRWSDGDDVTRYLTLLAMTAGLTGAGIFCGLGVKENRGARTLLGLVLALVPVHFTVIGGVLQSQFALDGFSSPGAPWNAASPEIALILSGAGLAVVSILAMLSMSVMVRPHAFRLTVALVAAHAPLLLPVRDPAIIAWMLAAMVGVTVVAERRLADLGYAIRTPEGRFVRALIAVPVALVAARTAMWYDPGVFFVGMGTMSASLGMYWLSAEVFEDEGRVQGLQSVFGLAAILGMLLVAAETVDAWGVPANVAPLVFALPAAALLLGMSVTCVGSGTAYRNLAAVVAVGASLVNLAVHWGTGSVSFAGLACLMVGLASLGAGIYFRKRLPTTLGAAGTLAGLAQVLVAAIAFEHLAHWGALAGIGVGLIFVAALFERHAARLLALAQAAHAEHASWEL